MDIPTFPYGRQQNVTRAVYDDGACVNAWRVLMANLSAENTVAVDANQLEVLATEVVTSLSNVFRDVQIPMPTRLHGFVHENAWHLQVADSRITNAQVFDWSMQPIPGKHITLIGEAYNLNHAAWCDGALKSAMWALTKFYGFEFPCDQCDEGSPAKCSTCSAAKMMHKPRRTLQNILP